MKRKTLLRLAGFGFGAFLCLFAWFIYDLPDAANVKPLETKPSITVLAADGTLIARYGGIKGEAVAVRDLPPYVVHAVIAVEDRRFYTHFGVDPFGLARAMWANIKARHWVQGGSTITQQLAKNLFLTPEKTLRRKVQEALLALWIDYKFTKDDILSAYLNRVYFGSGAYGIDAASKVYYGKPATQVTMFEGAVLAGLLKAPSRFSPAANPRLARDRAKVVIRAMKAAGYIDKNITDHELKTAKIQLAGAETGDLNRYFTDWVIDQIDSFVTQSDRDLIVRTTFDPAFQLRAEETLLAYFKGLKKDEKISQAALVTLARDGAVVAMIGGVDYTESQFNRAVQAVRQPGSSFKPFVYLAALESGYSASDYILDAPLRIGKYAPENYDGKYMGEVTLTDALAYSLNTATIRLLSQVGVSRLMDVTQRLGFSNKFKPELATGLGASETTLLDMTNAYAVIANGGYSVLPYAVLSIEDGRGNRLYERVAPGYARVFNTGDTRRIDNMLVQVVARGTGQAAQLSRGHVAGKTGTSQNYRDAWFIGYTDDLVTGIWMGNDDNSPMEKNSGGRHPARLWHEYMEQAIRLDLPQGAGRAPSSSIGDDFSRMLDSWSSGNFSRFTGSDTPPAYNQ